MGAIILVAERDGKMQSMVTVRILAQHLMLEETLQMTATPVGTVVSLGKSGREGRH